ncbi:hypothetical protein KI387_028656, partial [Taxus chinensis]
FRLVFITVSWKLEAVAEPVEEGDCWEARVVAVEGNTFCRRGFLRVSRKKLQAC